LALLFCAVERACRQVCFTAQNSRANPPARAKRESLVKNDDFSSVSPVSCGKKGVVKRLRLIFFAALVVVFLAALVGLMSRRLETGDVYPAYSSLRGDPMGTKALAESLDKLDGVTVERWYKPRLEPKPAAVFVLGVLPKDLLFLPDDSIRELQGVLDAGGRVILSLRMCMEEDGYAQPTSPPPGGWPRTGLPHEWGFDITGDETSTRALRQDTDSERMPRAELSPTIARHSPWAFCNLDPAWDRVYGFTQATSDPAEPTRPVAVIMERNIGAGSVVLLADTYPLSNEALHKPEDRHAALLVALLGGHTRVIFDEAHLGVREAPNLATLGRKVGLHWAAACLVLLAGLFLWKRMTPLLPPAPVSPRPDVTGRSSMDGLVNLLRRSVPSGHLLHTCVEEWQKTPAGGPNLEKRLPRVMQIMKDIDEFEDKQRDVAGSYNEIVEAVNR